MALYRDPVDVLFEIVGRENNIELSREDFEFTNPTPATPPVESSASYNTKVTLRSKTLAAPFVGEKTIYYNRLDLGDLAKMVSLYVNDEAVTPTGQMLFDQPGTYTWVVPEGVTEISPVLVGGGGSSGISNSANADAGGGGGGGGLRWATSVSVTPGESLTIEVGEGGHSQTYDQFPAKGIDGGATVVKRGLEVLLEAGGGSGGGTNGIADGGEGGTGTDLGIEGVGGGNGGHGGRGGYYNLGGAGGGAGGYSGNGGRGGGDNAGATGPGNGSGGGAGGERSSWGAGGGGGVGLLGSGADGHSGTYNSYTPGGGGGSGGEDGGGSYPYNLPDKGFGGNFGGGGGAPNYNHNHVSGAGGDGAVRIIWGPNREYPSINTEDMSDNELRVHTPKNDTTHDVIDSLNRRFGLGLKQEDIVLKDNVDLGEYKLAKLEATDASLGWIGNVDVLALIGDLNIEEHLVNASLGGLNYPTNNLQVAFAQFYSYWRDFSEHHDYLKDLSAGDPITLELVSALATTTGDNWVATGVAPLSLDGATIAYNGPTLDFGNVNLAYDRVMVIDLDPTKTTELSGSLVMHYSKPFDPMTV